MKKSLSFILAIALVFGLFASMASAETTASTPAEAGTYLQKLGVIKGGTGGDLLLGDNWTRQDVAILLSRLLNEEAAAKATPKSHTYTDVKNPAYDPVLSWAKNKKLMEGASATKFGFGANIDNQSFAAVILRALGVDTTGAENYAKVPELAVKAGILPEGTDWKAAAQRGTTYVVLVTALNTVVGDTGKKLGEILGLPGFEVTVATAISSAAATGAKKITVTFNGTVDTAKAKITVLNGANQVNSKSVTFAEDKKSAVVEFANNLPVAEYTVKVEGVTEAALTATVKVEAEKIAEIKILSDKAALQRDNARYATVGFKVLNQYGEDITASSSISGNAGKGTAAANNDGVITLDAGNNFTYTLGEKVVVSLVHVSGAFATATVEISAASHVASIDIVKLYQADGKELVAGSDAIYYLALDLKDQYGASIKDLTYLPADLMVSVSSPSVASVKGYAAATNTATYYLKPVDGTNAVVFELAGPFTAGTSNVMLISKANGAKDSFEIAVKEAVMLDNLTLSAPASAPAGATIEIPFTAVDQFGAAVKHPTNEMTISRSLSSGGAVNFVKDIVKDVTTLQVKLPDTTGAVILTIITAKNKPVQLTINVTSAKTATSISGIKDLETVLLNVNGSVTLGTGNVVVKDQYNNDYTPAYGNTDGKYQIKVESSDAGKVTVAGGATGVAGDTLAAVAKGNATITLTLQVKQSDNWVNVPNSSYSFTVKVIDKSDIKSYTASVAGVVYKSTNSAYHKALTVKGTLEDGSTVTIPNAAANFEVNFMSTNLKFDNGLISAADFTGFPTDKDDAEATILVVVKGASETDSQSVTVKISKATPVATTLSLHSNGVGVKQADGLASVAVGNVSDLDEIKDFVRDVVNVQDQYGQSLAHSNIITPDANIYITNISNGHNATNLAIGDTFSVTAITANGKSISFKAIVVANP